MDLRYLSILPAVLEWRAITQLGGGSIDLCWLLLKWYVSYNEAPEAHSTTPNMQLTSQRVLPSKELPPNARNDVC